MSGKIPLDYNEALIKAQRYCAREEKCCLQVRQKLLSWGTAREVAGQVLEQLIRENFINEERFAREYAMGKFKNNKWGKIKIANELMRLHIREEFIDRAMDEIDPADYEALLKRILASRQRALKNVDSQRAIQKIATFAMGKGFEAEVVWKALRELAVDG